MTDFQFTTNLKTFKGMLIADATMVSLISGSKLPVADANTDIKSIDAIIQDAKPYRNRKQPMNVATRYIAIRNQGTCYGSKEEVKNDCQILGNPVIIYRVDVFDNGTLEIKKRIK